MRKVFLHALLAALFPILVFAEATSTSFIIESDQAVAGGGRQASDSFTNIASVADILVIARATSTSFSADFGMAFWNAAHPGTLTVTETSDVSTTAAFTLSYASADPESPLFMACYGTMQAAVESSCTGSATRALTDSFSYRFSGLANNTTYYFRVYPLSGYDDAGNPIISPYYSATVTASRTVSDIFTPASGGSGSGGSGSVRSMSERSPEPAGIISRVTAFFGFSEPLAPISPVMESDTAKNVLLPLVARQVVPSTSKRPNAGNPSAGRDSFAVSKARPAIFRVQGTVVDSATKAGLAAAHATVYACPAPAARLISCSVWEGGSNSIMADSCGQLAFSVPAGIYRVRAEARGYGTRESDSIVVTGTGQSIVVQLKKKSLWRRIFGW